MNHEEAANCLAELGNSTRLAIFRYLVKAGHGGVPVGQLQREFDIPGSTLSHHLSRLIRVGLVQQVRESRTLYCLPRYEALHGLIDFLRQECCTGAVEKQ